MNKQQLASRIWASANNMRSKIEANEYKDYILGFIFYKFLSDKEESLLKRDGWDEDSLKEYLQENDGIKEHEELLEYCQNNLGYYVTYDNLFSSWLKQGVDFGVANVRDALNAFTRSIKEDYKKIFENIFETLSKGLTKLGDTEGAQTKAIRDLLILIDPIPMDDKQGYDVLGFIYEYLIANFAANAGKKAGEFYTPHEVSIVMSEIVANHLKNRETIEIYDPTSGSGSLLINIGKSISKYLKDKNKVKYYAQELKENTYRLTIMNLIMRGIKPENIIARRGDTLADDWPFFEEGKKETTYETLFVDAVVSNPPYSQDWEPHEDVRFKEYGMAPKSKADYAFLLHDLYHLKSDGIMTIVLPHGVLFRGGEEEIIRTNLVENDNIEAIIGLPANIFYGTGIPTIVMVLRKHRENSDVLIIDASKGFEKVGKNNKLRSSDIKRIVDTVIERKPFISKYSRLVSKDEIRKNGYNLNIPRYVDSSEKAETWDIYASMFGGIPNIELDEYKEYWEAFPTLRGYLFSPINSQYSNLVVENIKTSIQNSEDLVEYMNKFNCCFSGIASYLYNRLIINMKDINITQEEEIIANYIFERIEAISLINKYDAYQLLDNEWQKIAIDLEIIQTEGFDSTKIVDPNIVTKKKDKKEVEVQEGWIGRIIPFELIQKTILLSDRNEIINIENRLQEIINTYTEIFESLDEEDIENHSALFTEDKEGFSFSEVLKYVKTLKNRKNIEENSFENKMIQVNELYLKEKELKPLLKEKESNLSSKTKKIIENLTDNEALELLKIKWIDPIVEALNKLPANLINSFVTKLGKLAKKYEVTLSELDSEISCTESELCSFIDELVADEFDTKGLQELKKILGGK